LRNNLTKTSHKCYNCGVFSCLRHLVKFCHSCCDTVIKEADLNNGQVVWARIHPEEPEPQHLAAEREVTVAVETLFDTWGTAVMERQSTEVARREKKTCSGEQEKRFFRREPEKWVFGGEPEKGACGGEPEKRVFGGETEKRVFSG
jgi:hypothetical protein